MAKKWYSAFPNALAFLEPYHQIAFCHIQDTHWGEVGVFYSPSRQGKERDCVASDIDNMYIMCKKKNFYETTKTC